MKQYLIVLLSICKTIGLIAQCTIPNQNFDNFYKQEISTLSEGTVFVDYPYDWTESSVFNAIPRNFHGVTFFNKYEGADASGGIALELQRGNREKSTVVSTNKGYTRFECNRVPSAFKGRYKFSGTDIISAPDLSVGPDTLEITIKLSSVSDTLTDYELNTSISFSGNYKTIKISKSTSTFQDFEIDLAEFSEISIDYISIHLIMKTGITSPSLNFATAVIDDLELIYDALSIEGNSKNTGLLEVYPNVTTDIAYVKSDTEITKIEVYNTLGSLLMMNENESKINLSNLPKGIYVLNIENIDEESYTREIIKQ